MAIVPWFFGFVVLTIGIGMIGSEILSNLMILVQMAFYWLFLKWFIANLASNGQPLGLSFSGSVWAYLGWTILAAISVITIIGWAWVYVAWLRWFCRNIQGTRREVVFIGSGLEFLWRALVAASRQPLHHPDTVGVSMDVTVAGIADRFGRARRIGQRLKLNCAGRPRHAGERPAQGELIGFGVGSRGLNSLPCAVQGDSARRHALAPAMAAGPSPG